MDDDRAQRMPIDSIVAEDGAHELATSPEMQPYLALLKAELQGHDTEPYLRAIEKLPLEKRYVWRVASALKWAFADCEDVYMDLDRRTLSADELAKVVDMIRYRPMQLCIFLRELVGAERMQEMMIEAIAHAKQAP